MPRAVAPRIEGDVSAVIPLIVFHVQLFESPQSTVDLLEDVAGRAFRCI